MPARAPRFVDRVHVKRPGDLDRKPPGFEDRGEQSREPLRIVSSPAAGENEGVFHRVHHVAGICQAQGA